MPPTLEKIVERIEACWDRARRANEQAIAHALRLAVLAQGPQTDATREAQHQARAAVDEAVCRVLTACGDIQGVTLGAVQVAVALGARMNAVAAAATQAVAALAEMGVFPAPGATPSTN